MRRVSNRVWGAMLSVGVLLLGTTSYLGASGVAASASPADLSDLKIGAWCSSCRPQECCD